MERMEILLNQISELKSKQQKISEEVEVILHQISQEITHQQQIQDLQNNLGTLEKEGTKKLEYEKKIKELKEKMPYLQTTVNDLTKKLEIVKNKPEPDEAEIARLQGEIIKRQEAIYELSNKIKALEKEFHPENTLLESQTR